MGVISEDYIMKLVREYVDSDAGRARVSQWRRDIFNGSSRGARGALTKSDVRRTSQEIVEDFVLAVTRVIPSFRGTDVVAVIGEMDGDGLVKVDISVSAEALCRESLHYMNKDLTIGHGEGVKDILALFTHGYTIDKRPYGFWVHDNMANAASPLTRIGALMHRDPNPFLLDLVNTINAEYEGVCKATLNDKYISKGGG